MKKNAFTLVEFLIILAIVAILAGMAIQSRRIVGKPVTADAPTLEKTTGPVTLTVGGYGVQFLFMIDGMKVYRFRDGAQYIYIVDGRNSKTSWNESHLEGKVVVNTPYDVNTVK